MHDVIVVQAHEAARLVQETIERPGIRGSIAGVTSWGNLVGVAIAASKNFGQELFNDNIAVLLDIMGKVGHTTLSASQGADNDVIA